MATKKTDSKSSTTKAPAKKALAKATAKAPAKAGGKAVVSTPIREVKHHPAAGNLTPLHEVLEKLHKKHGHRLKKS